MPDSDAFEPHPDRAGLLSWLEWRYGMSPEAFADFEFWRRPGTGTTWIARAGVVQPTGMEVMTVGLVALRDPPPRAKPTSVFLQRFGHLATRSVQTIPDGALDGLLRGDPMPADEGLHGYVVVRTERHVVGCGSVRGGQLRSQLPRAWSTSAVRST